MLNYIDIGDCPVSDFLHQNRIPHIYEINLASEALCKLPEILPHMAVYNVPLEYQFIPKEIAMDLVPEYYYLNGGTSIPQEDGCVEDVDGMIWVSWYETVKEHELDRIWNVEETLLCNSNEGIKRPAVAIQPRSAFVPNPAVPYDNKIEEFRIAGGGGVPDSNVSEFREEVNDLHTQVSDMQNKLNQFMRGMSGDWDIESECEDVLSTGEEESKDNGSGGKKDMSSNITLKLSPYNMIKPGPGLKFLSGEEGKENKDDPDNGPCDVHIWLDIKKSGILVIKNGRFDVIELPKRKPPEKLEDFGGWLVFNWDVEAMKTCGGSGDCESCKDDK